MERIVLPSCVWDGHYEQSGRKFPQRMKLEFADGIVRGDGVDMIGPFAIDGEYRVDAGEVRLGWIKTYDGAHSVLYLGRLERGTLVGKWQLSGLQGGFALTPAPSDHGFEGRRTRAT